MSADNVQILQPFILNWSLRNIHSNSSPVISNGFSITSACLGEYPIEGWIPYFLEIPRDGNKKDISGRFGSLYHTGAKNTKWDSKRTISLPIYSDTHNYDIEELKTIINHWNEIGIPDDIPCVAIAIKYGGFSSDFREIQHVTVLIVWSDAVARIVSLDWFEGPLDDCITPEWYIDSSPLLNLKNAVSQFGKNFEHTSLDNISFSIFTIPGCLGILLDENNVKASQPIWNCEWSYDNYIDFNSDLNLLFSEIQGIFYVSSGGD